MTPPSRRSNGNIVASMAWSLHAIEQTQEWEHHRVDGVGRPKFDVHTGLPASRGWRGSTWPIYRPPRRTSPRCPRRRCGGTHGIGPVSSPLRRLTARLLSRDRRTTWPAPWSRTTSIEPTASPKWARPRCAIAVRREGVLGVSDGAPAAPPAPRAGSFGRRRSRRRAAARSAATSRAWRGVGWR